MYIYAHMCAYICKRCASPTHARPPYLCPVQLPTKFLSLDPVRIHFYMHRGAARTRVRAIIITRISIVNYRSALSKKSRALARSFPRSSGAVTIPVTRPVSPSSTECHGTVSCDPSRNSETLLRRSAPLIYRCSCTGTTFIRASDPTALPAARCR